MSAITKASPPQLAEVSPENLLVANTYLKCGNLDSVVQSCQLPKEQVTRILAAPEVKRYIDAVYFDTGYRNRNNLASAMDSIIKKKMEELEEAEIGSSKDIAELLQMAHKMRMEELAAAAKLIEAQNKADTIRNQTNIQINETPQGNYGSLVQKILSMENAKS